MTYKQVLFALAAFLAVAGMAAAATENGALSLANVSVSPNPVIAGGSATIRFQIYNSYDFWLNNVNLQPAGSYPLLNVSPLSSYHIEQIDPGLNPGYFNYTIAIPNTTPSGAYTLTFTSTYYAIGPTGVDVSTSSMPLSFYVQNRPSIKLVASNPQPAALYAGHNQTINIEIENTGYGTARNVSVGISAGHGASILSSVTSFFISNLTRGQVVGEPVLVSAENAGSVGLFANITYYSSNLNQRFHSAQNLSLSVAPAAQFSIASQASSVGIGATDALISFRITNTGTSEATQVQINLQTSYPVTPVASTAFIAELPAGATTNVTFLVNVDSQGVPGNYPVTMYEQWKQPNGAENQQFSGSNNYFVSVGSQSSNTALIVVAVILIIVAGVVIYRFSTKARAKQKSKK